jgi:hypothetical protein
MIQTVALSLIVLVGGIDFLRSVCAPARAVPKHEDAIKRHISAPLDKFTLAANERHNTVAKERLMPLPIWVNPVINTAKNVKHDFPFKVSVEIVRPSEFFESNSQDIGLYLIMIRPREKRSSPPSNFRPRRNSSIWENAACLPLLSNDIRVLLVYYLQIGVYIESRRMSGISDLHSESYGSASSVEGDRPVELEIGGYPSSVPGTQSGFNAVRRIAGMLRWLRSPSGLNDVIPIARQDGDDQKRARSYKPIKAAFGILQAPHEPVAKDDTKQEPANQRADAENPCTHLDRPLSRAFGAGAVVGFLTGMIVCFVLMAALSSRRSRLGSSSHALIGSPLICSIVLVAVLVPPIHLFGAVRQIWISPLVVTAAKAESVLSSRAIFPFSMAIKNQEVSFIVQGFYSVRGQHYGSPWRDGVLCAPWKRLVPFETSYRFGKRLLIESWHKLGVHEDCKIVSRFPAIGKNDYSVQGVTYHGFSFPKSPLNEYLRHVSWGFLNAWLRLALRFRGNRRPLVFHHLLQAIKEAAEQEKEKRTEQNRKPDDLLAFDVPEHAQIPEPQPSRSNEKSAQVNSYIQHALPYFFCFMLGFLIAYGFILVGLVYRPNCNTNSLDKQDKM